MTKPAKFKYRFTRKGKSITRWLTPDQAAQLPAEEQATLGEVPTKIRHNRADLRARGLILGNFRIQKRVASRKLKSNGRGTRDCKGKVKVNESL